MSRRTELRRRPQTGQDDTSLPVVLSAVLLAGAVAAAVSAAMLRFGSDYPVQIASVRLGEMTAAYAVKAAGENAPAATAARDARAWGTALETALARVAARHRAVLLPARAVAAGAPDITAEIEAALVVELARSGADGSVPQPGSNP